MRAMSILALLVGTVAVLNALVEARAGWATEGGSAWLASIAAAMLAGVLLVSTGVALLRRTPSSGTFARAATVVSLATFAVVGLLHPWPSLFVRLLGVGFPLVLMLFLLSSGGRAPRAPLAS